MDRNIVRKPKQLHKFCEYFASLFVTKKIIIEMICKTTGYVQMQRIHPLERILYFPKPSHGHCMHARVTNADTCFRGKEKQRQQEINQIGYECGIRTLVAIFIGLPRPKRFWSPGRVTAADSTVLSSQLFDQPSLVLVLSVDWQSNKDKLATVPIPPASNLERAMTFQNQAHGNLNHEPAGCAPGCGQHPLDRHLSALRTKISDRCCVILMIPIHSFIENYSYPLVRWNSG